MEASLFNRKILKSRRLDRGLLLVDLAAACRVKSPQTIMRWEEGQSEPSCTQAVLLARALGCDLDDLVVDRTRKTA